MEEIKTRDSKGRFVKGIGGGGRGPQKNGISIGALVRQIGNEKVGDSNQTKIELAIQKLFEIALKFKGPAGPSIHAIEVLLDRGWGKALERVITTDVDLTEDELEEVFSEEELKNVINKLRGTDSESD